MKNTHETQNLLTQYPLNGLTILLTDDDPFIRRIISHILSKLGVMQIIEAEDGPQALAALCEQEIHLMMTDIHMPAMNGIELIKQVRSGNSSASNDLPIIVITSFSNTEVLSSCIELDVSGFLVKPITPDSAAEKIVQAMAETTKAKRSKAYGHVDSNLETLSRPLPGASNKPNHPAPTGESLSISSDPSIIEIPLTELRPGMKLEESLYTKRGGSLLTAGIVFNETAINRINELSPLLEKTKARVSLAKNDQHPLT